MSVQPENPLHYYYGQGFDDFLGGLETCEADRPLWHPLDGFTVSMEWPCGCRLTGKHHNPLNLKKKPCALHPPRRPKYVNVAVILTPESTNPGYSHFEVDAWPSGTFSNKSKRGLVRMQTVLSQLEQFRSSRGCRDEQRSEIDDCIERTRELIACAIEQRPLPATVKIHKIA